MCKGRVIRADVYLSMLFLTATAADASFTFSDIEFWVGEGGNQAAMVIDWNNGNEPQALAWGYRWDGTATGEDMLTAISGMGFLRERDGGAVLGSIDGADPRLFARLSNFAFGHTVFGLGYDLDNDGGPFHPGFEGPANETGFPQDPDDHYAEGWTTGFWGYYVGEGAPYNGGNWATGGVSFAERPLSDSDWDGFSFAADFDFTIPGDPVAAQIPEPAALWLVSAGAILTVLRRGRKRGRRVVWSPGSRVVRRLAGTCGSAFRCP